MNVTRQAIIYEKHCWQVSQEKLENHHVEDMRGPDLSISIMKFNYVLICVEHIRGSM